MRAMREHLGDDFPLMVDANMRWSADQAVRAARGLSEFGWSGSRSRRSRTTSRVMRGSCARAVHRSRPAENLHTLYEFAA